jgi:glycosyltransferase 2 family protein
MPELRPPRAPLRTGAVWIGLAASVGFSVLALRGVDPARVWDAISTSDGRWLVPAVAALAIATAMRAERWRILYAPSTRPPYGAVTEALLIGYLFNSILPARLGEVARVLALHRRAGTSRAESVSTVVVERTFDVLALLVLLLAALPWLPRVGSVRVAALLAAVLVVALLAVLTAFAVWGERPLAAMLRLVGRVPGLPAGFAESTALDLVHGLSALRRWRQAAAAFGWTVGSWLVLAASAWCVIEEFGLGLPPAAGLLVIIATGLSAVIPSALAGLGVFEAAAVVALRAYHVRHSDAFSVALVFHVVNVVPFILAGLVAAHANARLRVAPVAPRPRWGPPGPRV